ncbi:hypothetical protein PIB30_068340 [Stylosanthes scabra]|uniref:Uncharacterized protein n=1 Tax=Stylosanthes scabra TaxID=79078 RepID=A0ABU6QMN1_9FABA|nr:hypothetical protein [Stylosanthes scabra]
MGMSGCPWNAQWSGGTAYVYDELGIQWSRPVCSRIYNEVPLSFQRDGRSGMVHWLATEPGQVGLITDLVSSLAVGIGMHHTHLYNTLDNSTSGSC